MRTYCFNTEPEELGTLKPSAPIQAMIKDALSIAVVGDRNSGKTATAHTIIEASKAEGRSVFVLKHPRPDLVQPLGITVLHHFGAVEDLADCTLWIDEPQLHLPTHDKKINDAFLRLLSLCRHNNVKIVISTSDTRFINRSLESYIDAWFIKDLDPALVKQGSKIKKIIQDTCLITTDGFRLNVEQCIFHSRKHPELNGKHSLDLPLFWIEDLSTCYRTAPRNCTNLAPGCAQ